VTPPAPFFGILSASTGRQRLILPLGIALVGLVINIIVATSMSETYDEPDYVAYGVAVLHGKPDRFRALLDSKMPVSALNALPLVAGDYLRDHRMAPRLARILRDMRARRYGTMAAAFCLCLLVFLYAQSLFGRTAGLFAQLIFVMEPNIIAHSTLATNDFYVAFGTVLALYFVRRYLLSPSIRNAALAALTLALAQLMKFTAFYLYAVLVIALTSAALYSKYGRQPRYGISLRQAGTLAALTVAGFLAVINAGFLFDRTFTPLDKYTFHSPTFQSLQQVPVLRALPLPLPYPYLQGFDWVSSNNTTGVTFGNIVLFNQVRGRRLQRSDGFPSYFLVAYALKEPIGLQIVLLASLVWIVRNRRPADLLSGEGLLLAAAAVIWAAFSFFSTAQVGIRHVLPALAIFTILSGGAFQAWTTFSLRRKILLSGCLVYAAISVGSYFPHMIPYFNEIVTDRRMAYHFLADSNLEWGQADWVVGRFLERNPDVHFLYRNREVALNPHQRIAGRVLMSANVAAGVFPPEADNFVRREGLLPVAQVGYGYLLFQVPERPATGREFLAPTGNSNVRKVTGAVGPPSIRPAGIGPLFSQANTIQPGEWLSIYGTNLASSTLNWSGDFPTSLGGTSVTINGKPAYLRFVSPGQINLQAPNDTATGSVPVIVTTASGTYRSAATLAHFAPSFSLLDSKHVMGIILRSNGSGAHDGGAHDILGPTGSSLGYATVAAKAGDNVELFGVGFGPTTPPVPAGQAFSGTAATTNPVLLKIGATKVTPSFAALSSAGLYQINVTIPANLATGDLPLVATVGGVQTQPGVVISLQ
jgi:uncharacterized protein (TIGR03437 family)